MWVIRLWRKLECPERIQANMGPGPDGGFKAKTLLWGNSGNSANHCDTVLDNAGGYWGKVRSVIVHSNCKIISTSTEEDMIQTATASFHVVVFTPRAPRNTALVSEHWVKSSSHAASSPPPHVSEILLPRSELFSCWVRGLPLCSGQPMPSATPPPWKKVPMAQPAPVPEVLYLTASLAQVSPDTALLSPNTII